MASATFLELDPLLVHLAADPDSIITGGLTRNAAGTVTSATVKWPDGVAGTYTADQLSTAFPGAVDSYHIVRSAALGQPQRTYTQPLMTRNAAGAVINRPPIVVT